MNIIMTSGFEINIEEEGAKKKKNEHTHKRFYSHALAWNVGNSFFTSSPSTSFAVNLTWDH